VLDNFFLELGAVRVPTSTSDTVRYEATNWFAEAIYLPEDGPNYAPRVVIGSRPGHYVDPRRNRIDVLHTTPKDSVLRRYNLDWSYTDRQEALRAFCRVRDEILRVYTPQVLSDPVQLRVLIAERALEVDRQWADEIRQHNESVSRQAAGVAFRAGDYESVVKHLASIPTDSLSASDKKQLHVARKKVTKGT